MAQELEEDAHSEVPQHELDLPPLELLRSIAPYFSGHMRTVVIVMTLQVVVVGLHVVAPLLLGQIIDVARLAGGADVEPWTVVPVPISKEGLLMLSGIFVLVILSGFVLEAVLGYEMARVGVSAVLRLEQQLFDKVVSMPPEFFRRYSPGRLIARVESDSQSLKNLFSHTGQKMLSALLTFGGIILVMLIREPATALLVLPLLIGLGAITLVFVRIVRKYFKESRRQLARMTAHITEYIQGIHVVQQQDYAGHASAQLREVNLARYRADRTAAFLDYGFLGFFGMCEVVAAALVVFVCFEKILAGTLTIGTLVAFIDYLRRIFMPIQMLSEFVAHMQSAAVSAGRIFGILATPVPHPDRPDAANAVALSDEITIEGVRFSYDGKKDALQGVDFTIPRGSQVALVGPSGGGKSTLAKLLLRFLEPGEGRIAVDDVDLRDFTRAAWRDQVSFVPQEVYLFPGSLADNLSVFDPGCSTEDIERACQTVGAEDLVAALPDGLASELTERGKNLSHGERQLLSLARAILGDPQILVLDEATSAIDPATEQKLQQSVDRLLQGRTALIVAHQLATIRGCDLILVIQGGRVVERGTHDELMRQPDGVYRELATLQLQGGTGVHAVTGEECAP